MNRIRLGLIIGCLWALFPQSLLAVSLGDIDATSKLGETFAATIPIRGLEQNTYEQVAVNIGTVGVYQSQGIDRPLFIDLIRTRFVKGNQDNPHVIVYSLSPIREMFVELVVEFRLNNVYLTRQFTVLLDLPTQAQTFQPTVTTSPIEVSQAVITPIIRSSSDVRLSVSTRTSSQFGRLPEAILDTQSYGPIGFGETLQSVSQAMAEQSGLELDYLQRILFEMNPQAFSRNDPRRLMAGYRLDLPRDTSGNWLILDAPPLKHDLKVASRRELSAKTQVQAPAVQAKQNVTEARLELSVDTPTGNLNDRLLDWRDANISRNHVSAIKQDISLAVAKSHTLLEENQRLKDKVDALEKSVRDIMQMLELSKNTPTASSPISKDLGQVPADHAKEVATPVDEPMISDAEVDTDVTSEESEEQRAADNDEMLEDDAISDLNVQENEGEGAPLWDNLSWGLIILVLLVPIVILVIVLAKMSKSSNQPSSNDPFGLKELESAAKSRQEQIKSARERQMTPTTVESSQAETKFQRPDKEWEEASKKLDNAFEPIAKPPADNDKLGFEINSAKMGHDTQQRHISNRARLELARALLSFKDYAGLHDLADEIMSDGSEQEKEIVQELLNQAQQERDS